MEAKLNKSMWDEFTKIGKCESKYYSLIKVKDKYFVGIGSDKDNPETAFHINDETLTFVRSLIKK